MMRGERSSGLICCGGDNKMELEEGEIGYFDQDHHHHNDRKYTSFDIDPDVDFAYIDRKVDDLLGHFRKDFEGPLTVENLGPKFGKYGSFLPAYKRPSSHLKLTEKVSYTFNPDVHLVHIDGNVQNLLGHFRKDFEGGISTKNMGENFRQNCSSKKQSPQKMQKNIKNAEIYHSLGLDLSPSSSMEDVHDESPTTIIQNMTSLPVVGLLSPRSDSLLHLSERSTKRPRRRTTTMACSNDSEEEVRKRDSKRAKGPTKKNK